VTQDPTLFRGAVRRSLDPLDAHSEDQLWDALAAVGMAETVRCLPGGLDAPVEEGGANWSVGERQLLCFARATLRSPKVLLLDEATASIDHAADAGIQRAIRTAMGEVTLLTIAHRLHTVVDYERILVMSAGRCAEAGGPHELLSREGSALGALVDAVGGATALRLRAIAAEAHAARTGGTGEGRV
jgi:ABC-type multidrug transport system fused ATPase/permease subunit